MKAKKSYVIIYYVDDIIQITENIVLVFKKYIIKNEFLSKKNFKRINYTFNELMNLLKIIVLK